MKNTLALSCSLFLGLVTTHAQTYQWAKRVGGTSWDQGNSIVVDDSGAIYTTGCFTETVDFAPGTGTSVFTSLGGPDVFISKMDGAGDLLWAKHIGGISSDWSNSIAVDGAGNVYVTGHFFGTVDLDPGAGTSISTSVGGGDVFIMKLDAAGDLIWTEQLSGALTDRAHSITVDNSGNVYVTGTFSGTVDLETGAGATNLTSAGSEDIFIVKLDGTGDLIWAKSMGGSASDVGNSVAVDGSGSVYITGWFRGVIDLDPGPGTDLFASNGEDDALVVKLDQAGDLLWAKSLGGPVTDNGGAIALDASGNVYITGLFRETVDFDPGTGTVNLTSAGTEAGFILKLDEAGDLLWAKGITGTESARIHSITVDDAGYTYMGGSFRGTVDFDPGAGTSELTSAGLTDLFLLKLDEAGDLAWAQRTGGTNSNDILCSTVDALGNIYATGHFQGIADFEPEEGTNALTSAGLTDAFIVKMRASSVGVLESGFGTTLSAYPNPTKGALSIDLGPSHTDVTVFIMDQLGRAVLQRTYNASTVVQLNLPGAPGLYFIELTSGEDRAVLKVAKE